MVAALKTVGISGVAGMFQTFDLMADSASGPARLEQLRTELKRRRLDGFVIPRAGPHQGEFTAPAFERLAWLTGFTGSAGLCIVLPGKTVLFTDGRYTLQARAQVSPKAFGLLDIGETTPDKWLASNLKQGLRLGIDPWLHSTATARRIEAACKSAKAKLIPVAPNPVDALWQDRPAPPASPINTHPLRLAGKSAKHKLKDLARDLKRHGQDAAILTLPDSIAWAFNIRASDIPHTPVALCFAIIKQRGKAELFVAADRLSGKTKAALAKLARIEPPDKLARRLKALGKKKARVRLDDKTAAWWFERSLKAAGAKIVTGPDPCLKPKACKTAAEIRGARAAHLRDGVALCRFLAWLDRTARRGTVTEISAAKQLEHCRAQSELFRDISFPSISGAGPNGAIVHYRVNDQTNRKLERGTFYLIDSGAQYPDGTTDVTRTIAIGRPDGQMRHHFTLVLKGHIAIARAAFVAGTTGGQLDVLARQPLWRSGLDFDHGTGHGVGSYLSVHEGPQRIAKTGFDAALVPGMILSNEPGLYLTGRYGIRIENLVLVEKRPKPPGGDRPILGFSDLTLAPYDRRSIDKTLLSKAELIWLNTYHKRVFDKIGPQMEARDKAWLKAACAPL
jgi:Xaa-Pro aminopeptidase